MKPIIAFLFVFLLAGCGQTRQHAQAQKPAATSEPALNIKMLTLDLPDFVGKTVTLQVTADADPPSLDGYLEASVTDESCDQHSVIDGATAEFDRVLFSKDRLDILSFKDTKITITGRVESDGHIEPNIFVTSYHHGWN